MKVTIECPYCDGQANLLNEGAQYFYKCNKCQEQFTTTETDTNSLIATDVKEALQEVGRIRSGEVEGKTVDDFLTNFNDALDN